MNQTAAAAASEADEREIVARIVAGDRSAFVLLMRRHNRRLYRLARATLRDDAEAEDALQEAYLSAYRSIGQFRGEAALGTWLSRLVHNECLGRLRRQARRRRLADTPLTVVAFDADAVPANDSEAPDGAASRAEMRQLLERLLDRLPEPYRSVFVMRSVEDLSVEETARCLGIPEATVRTRHFRARSHLREAMSQELDIAVCDLFDFGGCDCDRVVAGVLERLP